MSTFQDRLMHAFAVENHRRLLAGEPKLTKTDLWKAAGRSSGAVTHWFSGANSADMEACLKIAPLLRVDAGWLFDEKPLEKPERRNLRATSPVINELLEIAQRLDRDSVLMLLGQARMLDAQNVDDPIANKIA